MDGAARAVPYSERIESMSDSVDLNQTESDRRHAEVMKLIAETAAQNAAAAKAMAEARKISNETLWYPIVVAGGLLGAGGLFTTVLLKFMS